MKPTLLLRDRVDTDVNLAVVMTPESRIQRDHPNRPFHGLAFSIDGMTDYHFADGTAITVADGDLIYLPRGSSYYVESRQRGHCAAINFSLLEHPDEQFPLEPFRMKLKNPAQIERIYREADRHWRRHDTGWVDHTRAALYQLIGILRSELERPYMTKQQEMVLDTAISYIDEHFSACSITVAELAKLCGVSESWFRRLFAARYGVAPSRYITNRRIERAKELIASGITTIESAAGLSGFEDPAYFSRIFKAEVGMTPREYRDSMKEKP